MASIISSEEGENSWILHLSDDSESLFHPTGDLMSSDQVSIHSRHLLGRHVRAKKHLTKGEVILIENPYAGCLKVESNTKMHQVPNKETHFIKHTKILCQRHLLAIELTILENSNDYTGVGRSITFNENGNQYTKQIKSLADMIIHTDKMTYQEWVLAAMESTIVTFLLKNGFEDDVLCKIFEQSNIDEKQLPIILLRNILRVRYNGFVIKKTPGMCQGSADENVFEITDAGVGLGIYTIAAHFNHSCRPNALARFQDDWTISFVVTEDVEEGEEVTISYGPLAKSMPREERLLQLYKSYCFHCTCSDCFYSGGGMASELAGFICGNAGCKQALESYSTVFQDKISQNAPTDGEVLYVSDDLLWCKSCSQIHSVSQRHMLLDIKQTKLAKAKDILFSKPQHSSNNEIRRKAVEDIAECYIFYKRFLVPLSRDISHVEDTLARYYANAGDFASASFHCSNSIQILEHHFDSTDIELGYEYLKLAEILFNAQDFKSCKTFAKKAFDILSICVPNNDPILRDIEQLQFFCQQTSSL